MIRHFVKGVWKSIVFSLLIILPGIIVFQNISWNLKSTSSGYFIYLNCRTKGLIEMEAIQKWGKKTISNIKTVKEIGDVILAVSKDGFDVTIECKNKPENIATEVQKNISFLSNDNFHPITVGYSGKNEPALIICHFKPKDVSMENFALRLNNIYVPKILKIKGVARVEVLGAPSSRIFIEPDIQKMLNRGITVSDITEAIQEINRNQAFSRQEIGLNSNAIRSSTMVNSTISNKSDLISFLQNLTVGHSYRSCTLSEIATVKFDRAKVDTIVWQMGKEPLVTLKIWKDPNAQPLQISREAMNALSPLNHEAQLFIKDRSKPIKVMVKKTAQTIIEAFLLIIIVVTLFFGSWRGAVSPLLSIPISIIGTLFIMKITGCSINIVTLSAFVMCIGLVVDDSIVVVEKIIDEYSNTKNWIEASIKGTEKIAIPVILMTVTIGFIFVPLIFAKGILGSNLKEFAITLSSSVIISGLVSFTLSPMLCARIMKESKWTEIVFHFIESTYGKILVFLSKFRKIIVVLSFFLIGGCFLIFTRIAKETFPHYYSRNVVLKSFGDGNKSMSFLEKNAEKIVPLLSKYPIKRWFINMDNSIALHITWKKPMKELQIKNNTTKLLNDIKRKVPDVSMSETASEEGDEFSFFLWGDMSYEEISKVALSLIDSLENDSNISSIKKISDSESAYELLLNTNSMKSAGLNPHLLSSIVSDMFTPKLIAKLNIQDEFIKVSSRVKDMDIKKKLDVITNYQHHSIKDFNPLLFTDFQKKIVRKVIYKVNGNNAVQLNVTFKNLPIEKVINTVRKHTPKEIQITFLDSAAEFLKERGEMIKIIIFAITFIFLLLLAYMESLKNTIVIMLTIPMALFGSLLVLWIKSSINIYTVTGIITLIALIIKHGILFVSYAVELRKTYGKKESAILAAKGRIRPVLVTTICMAIGVLPILLTKSSTLIPIRQMSLVVFVGVLFGTAITTLFLPFLIETIAD